MEVCPVAELTRPESGGHRDNRARGSDTRMEENIYRLVYVCGETYDFVAANDMDAIEEVASTPLCPFDFSSRRGSKVIRMVDNRKIFPIAH